jgi:hypothetical protein
MSHGRENVGVSEVVGTVLLLGMAVTLFTIVYVSVLTTSPPPLTPQVNAIGRAEGDTIFLDHYGGEPMELDDTVLWTIGGTPLSLTIGDLLSDEAKADGYWNFGERLTYPAGNITDLEVEAQIIDEDSNAIAVWSKIQEGNTMPRGPKGGIWHFDEGSGATAYDSSGNGNHGIVHDPNWTTNAVNNTGLSFDGVNDYVEVPASFSLDISDAITVETWMKSNDWDELIDSYIFSTSTGYTPCVLHIYGDIYLICYSTGASSSDDVILKTLKISTDGHINETLVDDHILDPGTAPAAIHVANTYYAIVYPSGSSDNGIITTVNISNNGDIHDTSPIVDTFTFALDDCNEPHILHIANDIFAVTYGSDKKGIVTTFKIDEKGEISYKASYTFDNDACEDPKLTHISGITYAIAYVGSSDDGILKTVNITNAGFISGTGHSYVFEADKCDDPDIVVINDDCCAVAFSFKSGDKGGLMSFALSNGGSIAVLHRLNFTTDKCEDPDIILMSDNMYAIAFESGTAHEGHLILVEIQEDGTISDILTETVYGGTKMGYEPDCILTADGVLVVVHRSETPHKGNVGALRPGEAITPMSRRGIFRGTSYGIYVNTTTAFGSINGKILSAPIDGDQWNHIVLTYNRTEIALYVNGDEEDTMAYSEPVKYSSADLLIGRFFYGFIDEVFIYNRALTSDEIQARYSMYSP